MTAREVLGGIATVIATASILALAVLCSAFGHVHTHNHTRIWVSGHYVGWRYVPGHYICCNH